MIKINKIFFAIFFLCISTSAFASEECDDPYTNDRARIYYANGMNNTAEDWTHSREKIDEMMGHISQLDPGFSVNNDENGLVELLEVYKQKRNEPSQFWRWLSRVNEPDSWFNLEYAKVTAQIANEELINDADLLRIVDEYLDDLRSGVKVVIVAHSQGNLYANSAIRYIRSRYPQYKNSIGLVSVGTPANRVEGSGPHTTNRLDTVIEGVRLASNYGLIPAPLLATGYTFSLIDISGHRFVDTYIRKWSERIRIHINQTISRLEVPPKDFECERPEDVPIIVQTASASNIQGSSATLHGNIIDGKQADAWFIHSEGTSVSNCIVSASRYDGKGYFDRGDGMEKTLYGLKNGTIYSFRACGKNAKGIISNGELYRYRTKQILAPTRVSTLAATEITNTSAKIHGLIDSGTNIDTWFIALKNSFPSCNQYANSYDGTGSGNTGNRYYLKLTNLDVKSTYHYRFCGKGNTGYISSGATRSFKTTNIKDCGSTFTGDAGTYKYRVKMKGTGKVNYELNMAAYTYSSRVRYKFISNGNVFFDTGFGVFNKKQGHIYFTGVNGPYIDIEVTAKGVLHWNIYISCPI